MILQSVKWATMANTITPTVAAITIIITHVVEVNRVV